MSSRISALPVVVSANVADTDILPIVTGIASNTNVTRRISVTELRLKLGANPPAGGRTVTDTATYLTNNAIFNVKDFGAFGDGVTDDTVAVQLAYTNAISYANANGGAKVVFPHGNFKITNTINITTHRVHTEGFGMWSSRITFNPATALPLFKVQMTNTALVIYQGSFRHLSFAGAGTQQKILFDLWDSSEWLVEDIAVSTWTGNSGSGATPSIALRTNGREVLTVRRVELFADRPIHIRNNPNASASSEATDHFHFTDLYFSTQVTSETGILIDADVAVSNLTFDGYQAWVGGKYGLDYVSGGATGVTGFHASFHNVRYEQSGDATGYAFRWQPQANQNLLLVNCAGGSVSNGFFIRNTRRLTMESCQFLGGAGHTALDIDSSGDEFLFLNTFFQDLSTVNVGTLVEVFSVSKRNSNSPLPPTAYYENPSTAAKAIKITGNYVRTYSQAVAAAGNFTMPDFNPGSGMKVAMVRVAGYSGTGPIVEGGMIIDTPTAAALVSGTTNFAATNVGGKLCFLHGGNGTILNNTAQTLNVIVVVEWMP